MTIRKVFGTLLAAVAMVLVPLGPAGAAPDSPSQLPETGATFEFGFTSSSAAQGTCITTLDHDEDVDFFTTVFSGETSCVPSTILLEVQAILETPIGTEEAAGNRDIGLGFARSEGQFNLAPLGTTHRIVYQHIMTTTDGGVWLGADPQCTGFGTSTLVCIRTASYIAGFPGFIGP